MNDLLVPNVENNEISSLPSTADSLTNRNFKKKPTTNLND